MQNTISAFPLEILMNNDDSLIPPEQLLTMQELSEVVVSARLDRCGDVSKAKLERTGSSILS